MNETANRIPALFGSCVFNEETMQQYIQPAAMDAWRSCLQEGKALTLAVANDIADGMKAWALEQGATHRAARPPPQSKPRTKALPEVRCEARARQAAAHR